MVIVIGSAPWAIGSADRKHTQSAIQFRASLLMSVFMTPAYGPGSPFGELKVTRRTGVLPGGPGRCGSVPGDVRKALIHRNKRTARCPKLYKSATRALQEIAAVSGSCHMREVTSVITDSPEPKQTQPAFRAKY